MDEGVYAEILLPLALQGTYTYYIPEKYAKKLCQGSRVIVNFGKRKLYVGLVAKITGKPDKEYEIKEIESVYDYKPVITPKQFELWYWMADYYCCTLGEVMKAALSSEFLPDSEARIHTGQAEVSVGLTKRQEQLYNIVSGNNGITINELSKLSGINNPVKHLKFLHEKSLISFSEILRDGYKPLNISMINFDAGVLEKYAEEIDSLSRRAIKQYEIIKFFIEQTDINSVKIFEIEQKTVIEKFNCTAASLKSLEKKNLIKLFKKEISRINDDNIDANGSFELSLAQKESYEKILSIFEKNKPVLLHGVTSSGKTEIYISLIKRALAQNKTVLYLLPEIALTSQIIVRLKRHFGDLVGVYHSRYSKAARAEVYKSVLSGDCKILLGARSAVFLPFNNPGLIIVDEEHDASYRQADPAPRYQGRDTAVMMSVIYKSDIILGSATPSIESYYNTKTNKYGLVELTERYGKISMPEIVIADVKDGYRRKLMRSHFHPVLESYVKEALGKSEQIILFQNRRGYSPYIQCLDCGFIAMCNSCNVSLTYHKFKNRLVCHYCGASHTLIRNCPECNSTKLQTKGMGTEQIEAEAMVLFPEANIARLDYDSAKSLAAFRRILDNFAAGRVDILIGTQMVSKGLDFENVSLVGIMNADNMLGFPDYRAAERSFQMMAQVSGRAGRRKKRGKVVIQSFDAEHPVLKFVLNNDYKALYENQIEERKMFNYPPFSFFMTIRLKHRDKTKLKRASSVLAHSLKELFHDRVKGPEEPLINKLKNSYLMNIHIRYERTVSPAKLKKAIIERCSALRSVAEFASVVTQIDIS